MLNFEIYIWIFSKFSQWEDTLDKILILEKVFSIVSFLKWYFAIIYYDIMINYIFFYYR